MEPIKEISDHIFKYVLPEEATDRERVANTIPAQDVAHAITGGKSVEIVNAVIEGALELESVAVEGRITIQRTKIKGLVDCRYAKFKQVLKFHNSTFESDVDFTAAVVEKDITLNGARFQGKVDLTDALLKGAFYAQSCAFDKEANFIGGRFGRRAVFIAALFERSAMFSGCEIGGGAFFDSVTFRGEANFVCAHVDGRAMFNDTTFEGKADFAGARIESTAEFHHATFKQDMCFHGANVGDSVFFKETGFTGDADFSYSRIGSNVHFNGAVFRKKASFNSALFDGHALYYQAEFRGKADFSAAMFRGGATFAKTQFSGNVEFFAAELGTNVGFGYTIFSKNVMLMNANVGTAFFGPPEGPTTCDFRGKIDLRGCTYDRIVPTSAWRLLMDRLHPYDRQPFTQLENTLRTAGHDELADKVYYRPKCREFWLIKKRNPFAWLTDGTLWLLTGFGVRIRRLLAIIAVVLMAGSFVFHFDGAVQPADSSQDLSVLGPHPQQGALALEGVEPFWVSLKLFLPVEIPSASRWRPSSRTLWGVKFTSFATFLRLLGWVLVPLGVAGLSGWLKR
ncbi:MAG: pentapeptide repeat-containing protein [Candidatus Zixiibacteriota bacterium]